MAWCRGRFRIPVYAGEEPGYQHNIQFTNVFDSDQAFPRGSGQVAVSQWASSLQREPLISPVRLSLHSMKNSGFDDLYMELAENLSKKSHCVKMKVGAVISKDTRIVSLGYNGPPAGTNNCDEEWPETGCPRDRKGGCSLALHAEANAILYAAKMQIPLEDATLYVTLSPCLPCARIIYTTGIRRVIYLNSYAEYKKIDQEEGLEFLEKFGVTVERYRKKTVPTT